MAIGELLLAKGIINEAQLKKVLHQQKIAGGRIGDNLVALGYLRREELGDSPRAAIGAEKHGRNRP